MKDHLKAYKEKLEKGLCEYMDMAANERTAGAVHQMFKALRDVERRMGGAAPLTMQDAEKWASYMVNDDGSTGAHWTMDQTTAVAEANGVKFEHISEWCWWITMNMMYSDYSAVADKYGIGTAEFYADMAKAFLFDKDGPGPREKLSAYYRGIVCADYMD